MNNYTLKTHSENKNIFSGTYRSFIECIEDAVKQNINMSHINLSHKNLSNANLDGAYMPFANFKGANLIGSNLSECHLNNANFNDTSLYNTCFAYSELQNSQFLGASFGATLIDGCNAQNCIFSTLSCFDLDFYLARAMDGCTYIDQNYKHHNMSAPPIVLKGLLNTPIIVLDKTAKIGGQFFSTEDALPSVHALIQKVLPYSIKHQYFGKITG